MKKDASPLTKHDSRCIDDSRLTSHDVAISVRNLSKKYRLYDSPKHRLKEALNPFRKKYHRDFWALRDINLELPKGTTFGIIGQNGSGKSTLLQTICGILQPTTGSVQVNGRISALLELGAGFNKEYTGRENVFMQGTIMGIKREEMETRFDQIADFADIGHFIDQPAKTYSSGMYVRLAFACAINVDPDILVIDEALAVGDSMFQRRCYRKIEEFQKNGKTIVFVSHALGTVTSHCSNAMLLDKGKIIQIGKSKEVVNSYNKMLAMKEEEYARKLKSVEKANPEQDDRIQTPSKLKPASTSEFRYGSGEAEIIDFKILNETGQSVSILETGKRCIISVITLFNKNIDEPVVGMSVKTLTGIEIFGTNTWYANCPIRKAQKGQKILTEFSLLTKLNSGSYTVSIGVAELTSTFVRALDRRLDIAVFRVIGKEKTIGIVDVDIGVSMRNI